MNQQQTETDPLDSEQFDVEDAINQLYPHGMYALRSHSHMKEKTHSPGYNMIHLQNHPQQPYHSSKSYSAKDSSNAHTKHSSSKMNYYSPPTSIQTAYKTFNRLSEYIFPSSPQDSIQTD
jgi:hypothetical protein